MRNHPFVDWNKRVGLLAALVFLDLKGITVDRNSPALYELTMGGADGRFDKEHVTPALDAAAHGDEA